jgi:hypothetical protein
MGTHRDLRYAPHKCQELAQLVRLDNHTEWRSGTALWDDRLMSLAGQRMSKADGWSRTPLATQAMSF